MKSPWVLALGVVLLLALGFIVAPVTLLPIVLKPEPVFYVGTFVVTNTIVAAWLTIAVWIVIGILLRRNLKERPTGLQNAIEAVVEVVVTNVETSVGRNNVGKFLPLIAALFLMIVTSNWLGLLPGFGGAIGTAHIPKEALAKDKPKDDHGAETHEGPVLTVPLVQAEIAGFRFAYIPLGGRIDPKTVHEEIVPAGKPFAAEFFPWFRSANTDLNMALAFALVAVVMTQVWGIGAVGVGNYVQKFINFRGGPIGFLLGIIELVAEVARIISFSFRLFGNVFAGEVLLAVMIFLAPWLLVVPFIGLEVFVGLVQGAVFALLLLAFGREAMKSHDHGGGHGGAKANSAHH